MNAKLNLRLLAAFVGFTLSAFAQIDGTKFANDLRTKYGPPLSRETFTVRTGIEMVVDYAANGHVCRIQLPPVGPGRDPGVISPQAIDEFISELVPLAMRGKELRRWAEISGLYSVLTVEYENIAIGEMSQGQKRTGVTVTFTKEACREQTAQ
jgi:hypothetical protein